MRRAKSTFIIQGLLGLKVTYPELTEIFYIEFVIKEFNSYNKEKNMSP